MGNMSEDGESSCGLSFGEDLLDPCTYSNLGESVTNSIGGPVGVSAALSTADPLLSGISLVAAYLPELREDIWNARPWNAGTDRRTRSKFICPDQF